jgi:IS66 C-terminal element
VALAAGFPFGDGVDGRGAVLDLGQPPPPGASRHHCYHLSRGRLDDTALRRSRVTFNSLKHIDPMGTIVLPALFVRIRDTGHHDVASERGADRAAVMVTLIVTAKLNDVDPQAWLADVLARIADHTIQNLDQLLPWSWKLSAAKLAA